jgi:hypothetical protein
MSEHKTKSYQTEREIQNRSKLLTLFKETPVPDAEILSQLGLFIKRQDMSRILFMHELYKKILNVPGVIMEFGVRWGQNMALYETFRGMYEPFNHNRKIIGFDTFAGFPSVHTKDGHSDIVSVGSYGVTKGYEMYLERLLDALEQESPISHIKKHRLVKGDAIEEITRYFQDNPETIVSFAYFDFDIYEPTKKCLEAIKPHVTRGSVLGFDELNIRDFPGETRALKEVFGVDKVRLQRSPYSSIQTFLVIE